MTSGERLRELRRALGLSQAQFARGISISNGYIAGLELGNRKLGERIVKLVCAVYGVSERWLKEGEGAMFPKDPDARMRLLASYYNDLRPELQDYILDQIERLRMLQDKLE